MLTWQQQVWRHAQHIKTLNTQGSDIAALAALYNPAELLALKGESASSDLANMLCVLAYYQSLAYWMLVNGRWYRK